MSSWYVWAAVVLGAIVAFPVCYAPLALALDGMPFGAVGVRDRLHHPVPPKHFALGTWQHAVRWTDAEGRTRLTATSPFSFVAWPPGRPTESPVLMFLSIRMREKAALWARLEN